MSTDFRNPGITRRKLLQTGGAICVTVTALSRHAWAAEEEKIVNVYNWPTYIGEETIPSFEEATGIAVRYDLFGSNAELIGKLQAGNPGYDCVVASDFAVDLLKKQGLIVPLDHDKIPNIAHLDPAQANPIFDPGRKFSLPHAISTIGIGFRKTEISRDDAGTWGIFFDNNVLPGKKAHYDGARLTIGLTLQYLGYSANTTEQKEINEARDVLVAANKGLLTYAPDSGQDLLAAGTAHAVVEWSGDILQVMREDEELDYVVPKEGGLAWGDHWCIPKDAPHPNNAHKWINFVHDPEVQAEIMNTIRYGTGNLAAKEFINQEDVNNPVIYPPAEVWEKAEPIIDVGDANRFYDDAWTVIRSA